MAIAIAAAGIFLLVRFGVSDDDTDAAPAVPEAIPLDVWAPYWALDDSVSELEERIDSIREVSPFWYQAVGVSVVRPDPNSDDDLTEEFLAIAEAADAAIVMSVVDATEPGEMAAILEDPRRRTRHVDTLVAFAEEGDYAGIDLNYEQFAFADGRSTWAATRPNWVAFVEELADRLHEDDRTLTVSIPPVYDRDEAAQSGFWVYDHGEIIDHVDQMRIMAYDFSVNSPGPIAPLEFVQRSIDGVTEVTETPEKLVLGVPAYGRNWPESTSGDCEGRNLPGRTAVTTRTVDELIERRDATPEYDDDAGEYSFEYELRVGGDRSDCMQQRVVHYVDADGIRQRMDLARTAGWSGASLWALGFEDEATWDAILPTVSS